MHWGFGYYLNVADKTLAGWDSFGPFYEVDWTSTETYMNCCFNNGSGTGTGRIELSTNRRRSLLKFG
jgi:hypothetical protein